MATKNFYVTRDQQDPLYKTRMLKAGVAYPMRESVARWFETKFGVELTDQAPKPAAKVEAPAEQPAPAPVDAQPADKPAQPAATKAAPKKAARRKKSK